MIIAKIRVDGVTARTVYRKAIPAGIIGAQVEFDYADDIWHGLRKTVVFKGAVTKDVVTDANIVTIPHEVVEKPSFRLSIGIYGVDADGNIVIPTLWEDIGAILDAADPSGDTNTDPSLPVWAQIQAMIGNLDELETTARDNLVAAVNEVAQSGSASIAMRVDGGYIQYSTDNGKTWVNLIAESDLKGDKGADGVNGVDGKDGADGITPHIGPNGNWFVGDVDTSIKAEGQDGKDGDPLQIVNDLTTGGADKALSAEQGKVLNGQLPKPYELLETVTLVEAVEVFDRTKEPDNTPYALKAALVDISTPSVDGTGTVAFVFMSGTTYLGFVSLGSVIAKTGAISSGEMFLRHGRWKEEVAAAGAGAGTGAIYTYRSPARLEASYPVIDRIRLVASTSNIPLPVGTVINIYGVRA